MARVQGTPAPAAHDAVHKGILETRGGLGVTRVFHDLGVEGGDETGFLGRGVSSLLPMSSAKLTAGITFFEKTLADMSEPATNCNDRQSRALRPSSLIMT